MHSSTGGPFDPYLQSLQQAAQGVGFGYGGGLRDGDVVILVPTSRFPDSLSNPHFGGMCGNIRGICQRTGGGDYQVMWENGTKNSGYQEGRDIIRFEAGMATKKTKQVEKEKKFDPKELDALVIAQEARDEIEAVLKQHKNAKKLFEEWGLGETIEYGKGMTFMFYGTPGTGKTFGARCIGKALGCELLIISAAEIQSSEPGAANRNIQQAFADAKAKNKVLFLDECDSLITQRNDVGMVLGGEINTLLTEIEKFEGVCILATNRIETLDEALERRISLIVEFPEPTHPQRQQIWKKLIPKKMPLEKDVVVEKLADHKLTGGQIKNAVLQAARLALATDAKTVTLAHFESAVARIQKSKSLMGTASRYRQGLVKEDFRRSS